MVVFKLWNGTLCHFILIVHEFIISSLHYYWSSEGFWGPRLVIPDLAIDDHGLLSLPTHHDFFFIVICFYNNPIKER